MSELPDLRHVPMLNEGAKPNDEADIMVGLVLAMVDGKSDVGEIGEQCGLEADLARKVFGDLRDKGVVIFAESKSAPSANEAAKAPPRASGPRDLVGQVDDMIVALDDKNYYDILGVAPDADRKEMRSRFFSLSKKFHPDKAFGKDNADLRRKMEVVFRQISQAYETLSNVNQRREYDEYIADQIELWRIERQLQSAMRANSTPSEEPPPVTSEPPERSRASRPAARPAVTSTVTRPTRSKSSPKISVSPATVKSRPAPSRASAAPRDPSHDARREQWKRERLSRALTRGATRTSSSQPTPPAPDVEDKIEHARIAMEQGAYGDAADVLQRALELAPGDARVVAMMDQAKAGARRMLATGYLRQGMYERRRGDFRRARATLEKAVEADPMSPDARHLFALTLLDLRQDLSRALAMCRELVHTSGHKGRYFATLGELLLLANENEQAAEAFEKAAQLEPENKDHKKRLKACRA